MYVAGGRGGGTEEGGRLGLGEVKGERGVLGSSILWEGEGEGWVRQQAIVLVFVLFFVQPIEI